MGGRAGGDREEGTADGGRTKGEETGDGGERGSLYVGSAVGVGADRAGLRERAGAGIREEVRGGIRDAGLRGAGLRSGQGAHAGRGRGGPDK